MEVCQEVVGTSLGVWVQGHAPGLGSFQQVSYKAGDQKQLSWEASAKDLILFTYRKW